METLSIKAVHLQDGIKWNDCQHWITMVSKERQAKISRLKFDKDRLHSMMSEILARKCISEKYSMPYESIEFCKGAYGKPYVYLEKKVEFNWSHSGNWIVFVMDTQPVGIDVEAVKSLNEMDLARQFFAWQEVNQLEEIDHIKRRNYFFKLWTLKESYIKWRGTGMNTLLSSFHFIENKHGDLLFHNRNEDICFFHTVQLDSQHYASVCSSINYKFPPSINIVEIDEFGNMETIRRF